MKTLWTILMLAGLVTAQAQKKNFPTTCPELKQKMLLIKQSITDLGKLKKGAPDKRGYYATTFTLCGADGVLEIGTGYSVLTYEFPYDSFALANDDDKIVEAFVKNFRQTARAVFGTSYEETSDTHDDEFWGKSKSYSFKPYTKPSPIITIEYPFADNHVRISFEYEK